MKKPLVNVIIVTFNGYDLTEACIRSLFNCGYPNLKMYLVDNGSEKRNYETFYKKYRNNKAIAFIHLKKNIGFGGGCNAALRRITDGYIVFLSNDTEVTKNWLDPIIAYMEENPEVGACQPKIKDIKRKDYFEYAGAAGGFMDIYGFPFTRGRVFFTIEKDFGQYDNPTDVVWCSGVAIVTKKEVIDKTDLFDEIFFLYAEEADLCWRIHHVGYRLVFIPESLVYHYGTKKSSIDKTFFSHRNGLIMLIKNYSLYELIRFFPIRLVFDGIAFFYYLVTLYPKHSLDVIKAYASLCLLLPKVLQHRAKVDRLKEEHGESKFTYPIFRRSVVIEYFLKGQKTFAALYKKL